MISVNRKGAYRIAGMLAFLWGAVHQTAADASGAALLNNVRQLTFEGRRSGEGYFNASGDRMIFQSEREPDNPFFQIYCLNLKTGDVNRISNGRGKTTCAWIHPSNNRVLFASTHDDPEALKKQQNEVAFRKSGKSRRYSWDFDEHFEIYETSMTGGPYRNLTNAIGYDAEGSYSPDGEWIAFASNRHAYSTPLSPKDRDRLNTDASYFLEIYLMRSGGSDLRRLTHSPGYDGGPFFSPDGKKLCWRRFSPDGSTAEIWTMSVDGSDARQITHLGAMSWAPYFHPSGEYLIFTTNLHGFSNFELYMVDAMGRGDPVRVTTQAGFDGLPVFHPNGDQLAWTSNRSGDETSQIFLADFDDARARELLKLGGDSDEAIASSDSSDTTSELSPAIRAADIAYLSAKLDRQPARPQGESGDLQTQSLARAVGLTLPDPATGESPSNCHRVLGILAGSDESNDDSILVIGSAANDSMRTSTASAYLLEIAHYLSTHTIRANRKRSVLFVAHQPTCDGVDHLNALKTQAAIELLITDKPQRTVRIWAAQSSDRWSSELERRNVPVGATLTVLADAHPDTFGAKLMGHQLPVLQIEGCIPLAPKWHDRSEKVARLAALITQSITVSPQPPTFQTARKKPRQSLRPYLGTEPDYRGSGETGVVINRVAPDGPAAKGGMKPGDILIAIDDTPIANVTAYAEALDALQVGQIITVVVKRGDRRQTLTVTVGKRQ